MLVRWEHADIRYAYAHIRYALATRTSVARYENAMNTVHVTGSAQFNSYAGKVVRMRTFVIRSAYAEPIR